MQLADLFRAPFRGIVCMMPLEAFGLCISQDFHMFYSVELLLFRRTDLFEYDIVVFMKILFDTVSLRIF